MIHPKDSVPLHAAVRRVSGRRRLVSSLIAALFVTTGLGTVADADPSGDTPSALKKLSLEELFTLEITSVAKKSESVSETAVAIRVVTQDDLRRMGTLSIPEALRFIPGVEVARVDSRQYAITARGFNGTIANKLLVLIDGRSVYTPLFSGVFWDAQDTFLEDVEQIEVIRGPGGTVWGTNAVNGVINVISKPAASTQGLLLTGGGGNVERGFGGIRYGGKLGPRAHFRVYGKYFNRGPSLRPNGDDAGDDFQMPQGGFRADWEPSAANAITIQGDLYAGTVEQPTSDDTEFAGGNVLARWTRKLSAASDIQVSAYYDRTKRTIPSTFEERLDTYDIGLRHRVALGSRHDVVWGLGYRQFFDDIRNSPMLAFLPEELQRREYSGFVQDEVALVPERLRWTLGAKFEHNDYTGMEYQPSTRLAWTPTTRHTVWAAASRAVRTPSRIDRDLYSPASGPPYLLAGGPNFESEVLHAIELGIKARPSDRLTASISTFYNKYDELRSLEIGTFPLLLANGLEGDAYGAEVNVNYQARSWWRLDSGYTIQNLELEVEPGSSDTSQVKQEGDSPRHQWYLRSSMSLPHALAFDIGVRSVGELPNQDVPAYVAWDGSLGWQPSGTVELAVVGRDLFDRQHPEFGTPASRREIGRSFYGKVTCRF